MNDDYPNTNSPEPKPGEDFDNTPKDSGSKVPEGVAAAPEAPADGQPQTPVPPEPVVSYDDTAPTEYQPPSYTGISGEYGAPSYEQPPQQPSYEQQPYEQPPYEQPPYEQQPQYGQPPVNPQPYRENPYYQPPVQPQYTQYYQTPPPGYQQKSRVAAALLGVMLGGLGIHNFYLGFTTRAVIQLVVFIAGLIFTLGIVSFGVSIWGLVEGIQILIGRNERMYDANHVILRE